MIADWKRRFMDAFTDELSDETRQRIMRPLALAAIVSFAPMTLQNLWLGHFALAGAILFVQALLLANYLALRARRSPPIPHEWLAVPAIAAVVAAIVTHGIMGMFWAFPVVMYACFVLSRKVALGLSILLTLVIAGIALVNFGPAVSIRVGLSLFITLVIINIVLDALIGVQKQLTETSITDPLTGAHNRRHLDRCLESAAGRASRTGAPQTVLLIDIDHFKDVNDFHGHAQGDEVLRRLVNLVRGRARATDLLFRMGGEEFMLLVDDTRLGDGLVLAEALRREVVAADWPQQAPVTVSIGVAEFVAGESWEQWVQRADIALYRAKHARRNLVVG